MSKQYSSELRRPERTPRSVGQEEDSPRIADSAASVHSEIFRRAMRSLVGAVSVVSIGSGDSRTGFTATSVASLCVEPARMLVCVNKSSSSWPAFREHQAFGINILSTDQLTVADNFAGRDGIKGARRYEGADWEIGETGAPLLGNAMVALECFLEEAIERHTHAILIGTVRNVQVRQEECDPLLYWRGKYCLPAMLS